MTIEELEKAREALWDFDPLAEDKVDLEEPNPVSRFRDILEELFGPEVADETKVVKDTTVHGVAVFLKGRDIRSFADGKGTISENAMHFLANAMCVHSMRSGLMSAFVVRPMCWKNNAVVDETMLAEDMQAALEMRDSLLSLFVPILVGPAPGKWVLLSFHRDTTKEQIFLSVWGGVSADELKAVRSEIDFVFLRCASILKERLDFNVTSDPVLIRRARMIEEYTPFEGDCVLQTISYYCPNELTGDMFFFRSSFLQFADITLTWLI